MDSAPDKDWYLGPGMRLEGNFDYGKGCGICRVECPCGVITMVPENA